MYCAPSHCPDAPPPPAQGPFLPPSRTSPRPAAPRLTLALCLPFSRCPRGVLASGVSQTHLTSLPFSRADSLALGGPSRPRRKRCSRRVGGPPPLPGSHPSVRPPFTPSRAPSFSPSLKPKRPSSFRGVRWPVLLPPPPSFLLPPSETKAAHGFQPPRTAVPVPFWLLAARLLGEGAGADVDRLPHPFPYPPPRIPKEIKRDSPVFSASSK